MVRSEKPNASRGCEMFLRAGEVSGLSDTASLANDPDEWQTRRKIVLRTARRFHRDRPANTLSERSREETSPLWDSSLSFLSSEIVFPRDIRKDGRAIDRGDARAHTRLRAHTHTSARAR